MSKQKIMIWGRNFNLPVEYDVFPGEDILSEQKQAIDKILECKEISEDPTAIKKYVIKENKEEVGNTIDNIFKYVMPVALYAPRENGKRLVAILCDYRFDEEHGIAVVFENEKFKKVCPQDDVL